MEEEGCIGKKFIIVEFISKISLLRSIGISIFYAKSRIYIADREYVRMTKKILLEN